MPTFQLNASIQEEYRDAMKTADLNRLQYTGGLGRGIVMCAGGAFFAQAYCSIRVLRMLGVTLPIEIWYLGRKNEKENWMVEATKNLNVAWRNADELAMHFPTRILNGWELKAFAVLHSHFEEVLSLDCDSYPISDPMYLFQDEKYLETGAYFFPDAEGHDLHNWARIRNRPDQWKILGIPYREESSLESGQFIVNRRKCWRELYLAWWMNDNSDYYYYFMYGDKETFHLAWRYCESDYALPVKRWAWNKNTILQHDRQGKVIFQHRTQGKIILPEHRDRQNFNEPQREIRNDDLAHEVFVWQCLAELVKFKNDSAS